MPLSRSRIILPVFEPFGIVIVTGPLMVGTSIRAERRLLQGDRNLGMNIVILAVEESVRLDM
jgi:hypothetical protein